MDLDEIIFNRRSVREYEPDQLSSVEIASLLAVCKAIPRAGGIHVLSFYPLTEGNREALYVASLNQAPVRTAPLLIIVTAKDYKTARYCGRGRRYVYMEAGHAAQNLCLKAVSMGFGCVTIGAFHDGKVKEVLNLKEDPLYIVAIGKPKKQGKADA